MATPCSPADDTGGAFTQTMHGGVAGGQVGFNQQWANLVLGLEATADWSGLTGNSTNVLATEFPGATYQTRLRWLATLTPRLGYAWGNMLFYAKGGLAAAQVGSSLNATGGGGGHQLLHDAQLCRLDRWPRCRNGLVSSIWSSASSTTPMA